MKARAYTLPMFVVLLCATAVDAQTAAGTWKAEFDTPIGRVKYTYEFKVDGDKLTGKAVGQVGDDQRAPVEIKEGKVKGNALSFVEVIDIGGMDVSITYTGKLMGDEIRFTRKVGEFTTEEIV